MNEREWMDKKEMNEWKNERIKKEMKSYRFCWFLSEGNKQKTIESESTFLEQIFQENQSWKDLGDILSSYHIRHEKKFSNLVKLKTKDFFWEIEILLFFFYQMAIKRH